MEASGGASRGNSRPRRTRRSRGHIEKLKSGSLRVKVYAGQDALLRKPLYLSETVPAGADAETRAESVRRRLVAKAQSGDHPLSDATIAELMTHYLDQAKLSRKTRATNTGYHGKHVAPLLGRFKINGDQVDTDVLDTFYAELERCRDHCLGTRSRPVVNHWSERPHRCDARCRTHVCKPLKPWTIRKIHFMLNGAFKFAVRKKWTHTNPMVDAEPPPPPAGDPRPPTVDEAAVIIDAAWRGSYYGPIVWFATTTGARLGELCALRWRDLTVNHVDIAHVAENQDRRACLEQGCGWVLSVSRGIEQIGMEVWETDTKTHQHRRLALDEQDVAVLLDLHESRQADAALSGRPARDDDFIFHHPRGPEVCLRPGAVSTHYSRFTAKLGISTTFHKLRHYTATELIVAGIDITTVAGRLGHASAATTLKFYAAWRSEHDQRAATAIAGRVPTPPAPTEKAIRRHTAVFQVVADKLRDSIRQGQFTPGTHLPSMTELASTHRVSINAAHAAVNQLATWGFVTVSRGRRSTVTDPTMWPPQPTDQRTHPNAGDMTELPSVSDGVLAPVVGRIGGDPERASGPDADDPPLRPISARREVLQLRLRCGAQLLKTLVLEADITDPHEIKRIVLDVAATLHDLDAEFDGVLELDISTFGGKAPLMTYVMGSLPAIHRKPPTAV